jgi:CheY-like chemotaxis protein
MTEKTILVADDSPTVVEIMKFMLNTMGYRVEVATDGIEAIDRIYALHPDLILLDIEMPKMNGYQVCRLIKADRATQHIPVLILTSRDLASDRFWGLATGADEYVVKDLEDETLFGHIERLLAEAGEPGEDREPRAGLPAREVSEIGVLEQVNSLLDSRLFQSTIVNELGSLAIKMSDFEETVTDVLDLLAKVVDYAAAIVVIRDPPEDYVQVQINSSITANTLAAARDRLQAECDRHSLMVDLDRALVAAPASTSELRDMNTFEILPLRSRDRISGLLALGSTRENAISDDLMETLHIFAHEAAIVLDNSLLYRQLGRAYRELQRTLDALHASEAREAALRQEVRALKIVIDETKREKQVAEITETDYFQELRERARRLRDRGSQAS